MPRAHVDIQLRWGDQDAYGHINNVVYARYLEEARVRVLWLGASTEPTGLEQHFRADGPNGLKMLLASQQVEYLRVLEYSEAPITIELWIGKLGGSSLEIHYEVLDGAQPERTVVARAISSIVLVDGETLRPVRLSEAGREAAKHWMDEPVRLRRS
jgi:acyl-CoA thioester hydrolase